MSHNFIFDISADGHVEWLHFLAIVNRVARNMDTQVSLQQDSKCLGICTGVVYLVHL